MQHVNSHAENLGNECSDHAAALGAFGLVSNHNHDLRVTHLIPFHALQLVTTMEISWKSYVTNGKVRRFVCFYRLELCRPCSA